ncbi:MAG TPA: hypothetical protein VFK48_13850, partial [Usitatibacter sp.]|nr:hypothetical protein [Usitatibacter sp.]
MKLSLLKIAGIVALSVAATLLGVNLMSSDEKEIRRKVEHKYAVADPQFLRTMGALLGPPLEAGNRAETLLNGDQIFPAMLSAIRAAKRTITFETYIYWSG